MDSKNRILIGILVLGIVLIIGSWLLFQSSSVTRTNPITLQKTTCTQDAAADFLYSGQGSDPCERSCNFDNDCKLGCACGCISKEEECIYTGIHCEMSDPAYGCKCVSNTCKYEYTKNENCRDENYECTVEDIPCCSGLKEVLLIHEDEKGRCFAAVPCGSICLPCGDGICDGKENKCNCLEDCGEEIDERCMWEASQCDALINEGYYYDKILGECTYLPHGQSGCSDPPFETLEECESVCKKDDSCKLEPETGPCKAYFIKFYFDQEENVCKEFVWGGCGGIVPFEGLDECRELCEN